VLFVSVAVMVSAAVTCADKVNPDVLMPRTALQIIPKVAPVTVTAKLSDAPFAMLAGFHVCDTPKGLGLTLRIDAPLVPDVNVITLDALKSDDAALANTLLMNRGAPLLNRIPIKFAGLAPVKIMSTFFTTAFAASN
jgi:hypothetical protein